MRIQLLIALFCFTFLTTACGALSKPSFRSSGSTTSSSEANGGTSTDNPMVALKVEVKSYASNVSARLCVGRVYGESSQVQAAAVMNPLRLVAEKRKHRRNSQPGSDSGSGSSSLPAPSYQAQVAPTVGGGLQPALLSTGSYDTLVVELSPQCANGASLEITNASGVLSTAKPLQLRFRGSLSLAGLASGATAGAAPLVHLNADALMAALATARENQDLDQAASSTPGSFSSL